MGSNQGLDSRFNLSIDFNNYTPEELVDIFRIFCKKNEYQITETASKKLLEGFAQALKKKPLNFGNGRYVRNLLRNPYAIKRYVWAAIKQQWRAKLS